jgi:hypothetical protein
MQEPTVAQAIVLFVPDHALCLACCQILSISLELSSD